MAAKDCHWLRCSISDSGNRRELRPREGERKTPFAGDVGFVDPERIGVGFPVGANIVSISRRYPGNILCVDLRGDLRPTSWDIGSGSMCTR